MRDPHSQRAGRESRAAAARNAVRLKRPRPLGLVQEVAWTAAIAPSLSASTVPGCVIGGFPLVFSCESAPEAGPLGGSECERSRDVAFCDHVTLTAVSHPLCRLDAMSSYRFRAGCEALGQERQQVHSGCHHARRRRRPLRPRVPILSEALPGRVRRLWGLAGRAEAVVRVLRQDGARSSTSATSSRSDSRCDPPKGDQT